MCRCAPGSAPVKSPCGVFAGGLHRNTRDMLDLDRTPMATWVAGETAEVMYAITANHGGGFSYRLCPHSQAPTEDCFQSNQLKFVGDTQYIVGTDGSILSNFSAVRTSTGTFPPGSQWTRNPIPQELNLGPKIPGLETTAIGRGPFDFSVMDKVAVPAELPQGDYVLSWRWDAEQTKQVWSHCSDVKVINPSSKQPEPLPLRDVPVCIGQSIGLNVDECNAWVDLYDALDGEHWPDAWSAGCSGRLDPCGCGRDWQKSIKCNGLRDYLSISEIYILGKQVAGVLPKSIKNLTQLKALSIVESNLRGPLPNELGEMPNLVYIWLDHNPKLDGPIPMSLVNMTQLYALELHQNSLTGTLPIASWKTIADCALQGNTFACPLPEGALACGASCK